MNEKNHFQKWAETVKELKKERLISHKKKYPWARVLAVNKQASGNPFEDRPPIRQIYH